MASPRIASSIAQVSRESVRVEKLRGSVQTVFPIHACIPPTANNSETQDYGTVGSDGPIEGAAKVFQITLRDLSVPGSTRNSNSNSLHHRINAYFYDKWADRHHAGIGPGDEIEVSGPAARLVHPDPSAFASGDHPFCLVFHTADDDALLALGAVAADHLRASGQGVGSGVGAGAGVEEDIVSCRVVRKAEMPRPSGGAAAAGRGGRGGRGGSKSGGRSGKASYVYTNLDSLQVQEEKTNVYGVVCSFTHRHQSRGRDMTNSVGLLDETCPDSDSAVPCNFFHPSAKGLPAPVMVGDIVRLHRAKVQEYRGRPQLLAAGGTAWLVIRKKQTVREAFQKVPIGMATPAAASSGGKGGGGKSPHMWLKPSSEVKVWIKDVFRRPQAGPAVTEAEVDLVCCLTSKHEKPGGGAGSMADVYVADGTGFAASMPVNVWNDRREAALLKGMRAALRKPGWSPGDPRPLPVPAQLKVEVVENKKEWEALALSPGMWVRLRRLTITKNRETGNMSAKMKDKGSCVNPLHPSMAEVQHIATSYATHCASASGGSKSPVPSAEPAATAAAAAAAAAPPPPPQAAPAPAPASVAAAAATSAHQPAVSLGVVPAVSNGGGRETGASGTGVSSALPVRSPPGAAGRESTPPPSASTAPLPSTTRPPAGAAQRNGSVPPAQPGAPRSGRGGGCVGGQGADPAANGGGGEGGDDVRASSRGVANGGGGAGVGGGEAARGTKRPLPGSEGSGAGAAANRESAAAGGGPVSNLGVVRSTTAPHVFDTRARIVSHWPPMVKDFVRKGPRWSDGPSYLFTLRLEDDFGVVDAVAAGPEAARLLPGCPSPAEFLANADARARVERVLAGLVSAGAEGAGGGLVDLRLRSYLAPLVRVGQRGSECKRYSIIAPSCLDGGRRAQGEG
eukprot:g6671.t1